MVRHDMAAHKAHLESERLRLKWGLLTPAEKEVQARLEATRMAREAKQAAKGEPLFQEEDPV